MQKVARLERDRNERLKKLTALSFVSSFAMKELFSNPHVKAMPTLTRLILIFLVLALAFFGVMLGLVFWVKPVVSELTIDVPADDIVLRPWPSSVSPPGRNDD